MWDLKKQTNKYKLVVAGAEMAKVVKGIKRFGFTAVK